MEKKGYHRNRDIRQSSPIGFSNFPLHYSKDNGGRSFLAMLDGSPIILGDGTAKTLTDYEIKKEKQDEKNPN